MAQGALTILGVPIDSVGERGGTELGPASLRERLGGWPGRDAGDTEGTIRGRERDPESGWLAYPDCVAVTAEVRERVAEITEVGDVPVVLGGCCTLLPGALAGARDSLGPIGLAYLDGHLDLFTGQTSPTGEGADMPVAALLGEAPPELREKLGPTPVVEPARIALLGARDAEEVELIGDLPERSGIATILNREALAASDLAATGQRIEADLTAGGGRFWLHLDVDVLGQDEFPATDYLMPGGLDMQELRVLMAPLAASPGLIGVNVTCFNPEKDPDGSCGRRLAALLTDLL